MPISEMGSALTLPAEVLVSDRCTAFDRQKPGRMASLDSLRGIAILMVICAHYLPQRLAFGAAGNAISTLGRGGVIMFFCLADI